MTAEVKLRTAAAADATLAGYLASGSPSVFRWFDTQLPQGQIERGTCVRVQRISTARSSSFAGIQNISWPRFQVDVMDADPELGRTVAKAIIDFLNSTSAGFGNISGQAANFVLNEREGMNFDLQPPVFVHSIDVRIFNLEE